MSTAAAVRAAWNTAVWANASVTAITDKIYDREMPLEGNQSQLARLVYQREFNFFQYIIKKYPEGGQIGSRRYIYSVTVDYFREADPDGENHNAAVDAFNTIDDRVISGLGTTWSSTVDRALILEDEPTIDELTISGKRALQVSKVYQAEKYIADS